MVFLAFWQGRLWFWAGHLWIWGEAFMVFVGGGFVVLFLGGGGGVVVLFWGGGVVVFWAGGREGVLVLACWREVVLSSLPLGGVVGVWAGQG